MKPRTTLLLAIAMLMIAAHWGRAGEPSSTVAENGAWGVGRPAIHGPGGNHPRFGIGETSVDYLAWQPSARSSKPQRRSQRKPKRKLPLPAGVQLEADLIYARPKNQPLQLDLYRPKSISGPLPTIVFVHGGGWKNGDKSSGRRAAWLAEHGFAIASINYRLTDKGQWPDQINDCYAAVRWLRTHAKEYQLDAERIGCWGSSAGGHLAALMGTRRYPAQETVSSRVQAVCDWFGPAELLTMPPNTLGNGRTEEDIAKSNGAKLLGDTVRDVPDKARDASALDHVSADDPPFLIMHGTADPGVPFRQSQRLHDKLKAAGVSSTLIPLEGAGHGGAAFTSESSKQAMLEFFTAHLKR